ncbi:MAG: hypothetical protein HQ596_02775 [Candidatus Saganbacteria bacterium]|nr:hypothetical protein [Candidatus Saganbacteria bacterium]
MSLYLGARGRSILEYTIRSPRLSSALGKIGIAETSRRTFALWQKLKAGDPIAADPFMKSLLGQTTKYPFWGNKQIQLNFSSPEELAKLARFIRKAMQKIKRDFPKEPVSVFRHWRWDLLPAMLNKVQNVAELGLWHKNIIELISNYIEQFGWRPANDLSWYIDQLGSLMARAEDLGQFERLMGLIESYSRGVGNPSNYLSRLLPALYEKAQSFEELEGWDKELKALIKSCPEKSRHALAGWSLPTLLNHLGTLNRLKTLAPVITDYCNHFGDSKHFVSKALPALLEKTEDTKRLVAACSLITSYAAQFGNPRRYTQYALPDLFGQIQDEEGLTQALSLTAEYSEKAGNPYAFVRWVLPTTEAQQARAFISLSPHERRQAFYTRTHRSKFFPRKAVYCKQPSVIYMACRIPPLIIGGQDDLSVGDHVAYFRFRGMRGAEYFGLKKYVLLEKKGQGPVYFFDDHRFWFYALVESVLSGTVDINAGVAQLEYHTPDHLDFEAPGMAFNASALSPHALLKETFNYAGHSLTDVDHNVAALHAGLAASIYHFPVDPERFSLSRPLFPKEVVQGGGENLPYQKLVDANTGTELYGAEINWDISGGGLSSSVSQQSVELGEFLSAGNSVLVADLDAFLEVSKAVSFREELDNRPLDKIPDAEKEALDNLAGFLVPHFRAASASVIITSPGFAPQDSSVYLSRKVCELY